MSDSIINRVAESAIVSLDLETFFPKDSVIPFDLKDYLFMELIVKEKEFRLAVKNIDLELYRNHAVAIYCSTDAIIPMWAYMLVAAAIQPVASEVILGTVEYAQQVILLRAINSLNVDLYRDKKVVIKGCGETPIPESAYVAITMKLKPVVQSLMYGEPCSTVPIYKKSKIEKD